MLPTRDIRFIADDFGLSDEVNEAILRTHVDGALHGAGLMIGQEGTENAIALARAHPSLLVGWHLHLNDSLPCTVPHWPWGASPAKAGFAMGFSPAMRALVRREVAAQWQAFLDSGLECHFVNVHHHLQFHPFVRRVLVETLSSSSEFLGWLRWGRPRFFAGGGLGYDILNLLFHTPFRNRLPFQLTTSVWGIDRPFAMNAREIASVIPELGAGLHEFIFHPRSLEADRDTRCLMDLREQLGDTR